MTLYAVRKEELEATTPGVGGARLVGIESIPGITATELQTALEVTAGLIDQKLQNVREGGILLANRPTINFEGAGVDVSDNVDLNRIDVRVAGLADYPHVESVTQEGQDYGQYRTLNVTGAGATLTENVDDARWDLEIPGDLDADIPPAGTEILGKVLLSEEPGDASNPRVVVDTDARLSDTRAPQPHAHEVVDLPVAQDGQTGPELLVASDDSRLSDRRLPESSSVGLDEAGTFIVFVYVCDSTTRPESPKNGQVIWETDAGIYRYNAGTPSAPDWQPFAGGGGGTTYAVQEEGSTVTSRTTLNFVGAGATVTDDSVNSKTQISIPGLKVQSGGSDIGTRGTLNIIGATSIADDSGNGRVNVTIPGAGDVTQKLQDVDLFPANWGVNSATAPATSGSLTTTLPANTAYVSGVRVDKASLSRAFTASKDTYVDLSSAGVYAYTEVTVGAAAPTLAANHMRMWMVRTGASTITTVTDLRKSPVANPRLRSAVIFGYGAADSQSFITSTVTKQNLQGILYDPDGVWDSANSRFVAPYVGKYRLWALATWDTTAVAYAYIYKNGAMTRTLGRAAYTVGGTVTVDATTIGDYFDFRLNFNAAATTQSGGSYTRMEGEMVGQGF